MFDKEKSLSLVTSLSKQSNTICSFSAILSNDKIKLTFRHQISYISIRIQMISASVLSVLNRKLLPQQGSLLGNSLLPLEGLNNGILAT